jgi:multiple sugar transport system substrate-binding protein
MRRRALTTLTAAVAVAALAAACGGGKVKTNPVKNANAKEFSLTITSNSIAGGKNSDGAKWVTDWVIPRFVEKMKKEGKTAHVTFQPSGVDDEQYKSKLELALQARGGADIIAIDGIWVGEFAQANYIADLNKVVGNQADKWDGWKQIPPAVQTVMNYQGKRYGVPQGTDGRVLFFNKQLFQQAGLPADWQPKTWDDIISAGQKLKTLPGVTPIQINAGTAMGEATTMQGVLPLLAGTGRPIYANGKWQGDSEQVKDVLGFYQKVYGGSGLGDAKLQQEAQGRSESFTEFSQNKIGILLESDYLWRGVLDPKNGVAPMANRDQVVGWAKIPAMKSGSGLKNQNYVSMSGGSGWVVNANTKYPQQAWELLQFMGSKEAVLAGLAGAVKISPRDDVNKQVVSSDPMLNYIATQVLPLTAFRPGLADYPKVSTLLQQATADVVAGKSRDDAAKAYADALKKAVGDSNVSN